MLSQLNLLTLAVVSSVSDKIGAVTETGLQRTCFLHCFFCSKITPVMGHKKPCAALLLLTTLNFLLK